MHIKWTFAFQCEGCLDTVSLSNSNNSSDCMQNSLTAIQYTHRVGFLAPKFPFCIDFSVRIPYATCLFNSTQSHACKHNQSACHI